MNNAEQTNALPTDSAVRKNIPLARGLLDYFPAALAEVARLSQEANEKHNPGEPMHHARGKSMDHADCIMRHLVDRGTMDTDDFLHDVKVAWRALAQLQEALEARGAPLARGARVVNAAPPQMGVEDYAELLAGMSHMRLDSLPPGAVVPITRGANGLLGRWDHECSYGER